MCTTSPNTGKTRTRLLAKEVWSDKFGLQISDENQPVPCQYAATGLKREAAIGARYAFNP